MARAFRHEICEGQTVTLLARHILRSGEWLAVQDVQLVLWRVFDDGDPASGVLANGVCVPTLSVFDTLQTGPEWTEDEDGYNVSVVIPGVHLSRGGTVHRVEITLILFSTGLTGQPYDEDPIVFLLDTKTLSS